MFHDRTDAGHQLAQQLLSLELGYPTILAIPRGGILVGVPIAQCLRVPLGVVMIRRLTCARYPEIGFGAIGEGGISILDPTAIDLLQITPTEIMTAQAQSQAELQHRLALYRSGNPLPPLTGQTVIIVDDGLATGLSAQAAIQVVQAQGATQILIAVPVASPVTVRKLKPLVNQIICVAQPSQFRCVAEWYQDFNPNLSDDLVLAALAQAQPN